MAKGVFSKGTKAWMLHGTTTKVLTRLDCVKSFKWGDDGQEEIDVTCLDDDEAKSYENGILDPSGGEIMIQTDLENNSHLTLLEQAQADAEVIFYVGWSDGTAAPTLNGNVVTLPDTRTWDTAIAKLKAAPTNYEQGSMNSHTVTFRRRSKVELIAKSA